MKGAIRYGPCTVHRRAVPPHGVLGFHELNPWGVSAVGSTLRGAVPRPYGGEAHGRETADCPPVSRGQKLSPPDTGRSALVHPGLPQNLCLPGGTRALLRDDPEQNHSGCTSYCSYCPRC